MKTPLLLLLILGWLLSSAPASAENDRLAINVLADASLSLPLSEIARDFSAHNHLSVTCAYAPALRNLQRVEEGESADIFITAYGSLLEQLRRKGMIDVYSIQPVASAKLGWVRNISEPAPTVFPTAAVIPSPTLNPEGQYAETVISGLKPSPAVHYVPSADQLPDELKKTHLVGITYETDITRLPTLALVPSQTAAIKWPLVSFRAAVVAGENMDQSRAFMRYLASDAAKAVFRKYGFAVN